MNIYIVGLMFTLYTLTEFLIYQPLYQIVKGETKAKSYARNGTLIVAIGFLVIFFLLNQLFRFQTEYSLIVLGMSVFYPIYPWITLLVAIASIFLIIKKVQTHRKLPKPKRDTSELALPIIIYLGAIATNVFTWLVLNSLSNILP